MRAAQTFTLRADAAPRFARAASETIASMGRPAGAIMFLSGALAENINAVAAAFDRAPPGVPLLLAAAAGVLTEKGELEGQSAGAGLVWSGGESDTFTLDAAGPDAQAELVSALRQRSNGRAPTTALLLAEPRQFSAHLLEPLGELERVSVLGAGTRPEIPIIAVAPNGKLQAGSLGVLVMRGPYPSIVRSSAAVRLLTSFQRVTEAEGSMLLSLEGEPALDVLKNAAAELAHQPLVLAALAPDGAVEDRGRPEFLVRNLQGVDPDRSGVLLNEPLKVGARLAFAVRDAAAARADLEHTARELWRETAGAAPQFGFYLSCAGRGSGLYGATDVDIRLLRARFPSLPLVGLHSSFEIAPCAGRPSLQLYTGVVGIFTAPS